MKRTVGVILALGFSLSARIGQADWETARRLTWTSGSSRNPAVAIDASGAIHVVWDDSTPFNYEIYYKKSTDQGVSWSPAKRLTWTSGSSWSPAISIGTAGLVHVVWYDDTPGNAEIYYKKSTDGGATWSPAKRLTWTSNSSYYPDVACGPGNRVHVAWEEGAPSSGYEIYYKNSSDGGTTWVLAKRLTWTSGTSAAAALAPDSSGAIHLVWRDYTPFYPEIYYNKSTDGGETWSTAKRLSSILDDTYIYDPDMAVDPDNIIHLVWSEGTASYRDIYWKKSTDGGETWSAVKRLTWTSGESWQPALAIDPFHGLHVLWYDETPGNPEIYYLHSTDQGATWSTPSRLTSNSGESYRPAVVIDLGALIHIVWMDDTPGNNEIYYRKGQVE